MMKLYKYILILSIGLLVGTNALAQVSGSASGNHPHRREKIEAAKVTFITNKLNLTPAQSRDFWPIYNEFTDKRMDLRKRIYVIRRGLESSNNEAKAKENLNQYMNLRQEELEVEKQYAQRFQKVISSQQVLELYEAEREFVKMLVKKMAE